MSWLSKIVVAGSIGIGRDRYVAASASLGGYDNDPVVTFDQPVANLKASELRAALEMCQKVKRMRAAAKKLDE